MEDGHEAELREHYERGEERDRLDRRAGRLKFARTTEIILRRLPPEARAVILDTARALERVPELLGIGPHLLATGVRR